MPAIIIVGSILHPLAQAVGMLGVLALVILWPDVVLFLPSLISPEFLR